MKTKTCPICGAEFEPEYNASKYCSEDCAHQAQLERQRVYHHKNRNKSWYRMMRLKSKLKRK